jgi:hypothetical protein
MLQILIKVLERKGRASRLLLTVARMEWIKELSGKWPNSVVQQRSFSDVKAVIFFLFPVVLTTIRHRIFYNVKCPKMIGRAHIDRDEPLTAIKTVPRQYHRFRCNFKSDFNFNFILSYFIHYILTNINDHKCN